MTKQGCSYVVHVGEGEVQTEVHMCASNNKSLC